jgi:hypothetical protein
MPFVERNANGSIVAVHDRPLTGATEELPADHRELVAFHGTVEETRRLREGLSESDLDIARVIEDLIEALLRRGLILPTDLPSPALTKITQRRQMRSRLRALLDPAENERNHLT